MNNFEIVSLMETLGYKMVRRGSEYHGNCPRCCDPEGNDRFMVYSDGNAFCRRCENWWNPDKFRREFFGHSSSDFIKHPYPFLKESPKTVRIIQATDFNPLWSRSAEELVYKASKDLIPGSWGFQELERRGIRPDLERSPSLAASGLGYVARDMKIPGAYWGLSRDFLWVPQGILIPFIGAIDGEVSCLKLKVRRERVDDTLPKYIEISGSSKKCTVLGYHSMKPALIAESELDAILCLQEASDLVWCVALGGASKPVDEETDELLKKASSILWALDQDEAGKKHYFAWRERYSQLRAWPADKAKSPGDMPREKIRSWVERGIQKYKEKDWVGQ